MISSLNLSASGCHSIAMTIVLFMEQSTAAVNTRTTETHTHRPRRNIVTGPRKISLNMNFIKNTGDHIPSSLFAMCATAAQSAARRNIGEHTTARPTLVQTTESCPETSAQVRTVIQAQNDG